MQSKRRLYIKAFQEKMHKVDIAIVMYDFNAKIDSENTFLCNDNG